MAKKMVRATASRATKNKSEILSKDDEFMLARAWRNNQDKAALNRLILAYRPFALKEAAAVAKRTGLEIEDLAQEAFLTLQLCADNFDPDMNNRFSTFARYHIMGHLRQYVMEMGGPCRVGTNLSDKRVFLKFRPVRAEIEMRTQAPLDDAGRDEMAATIGVPRKVIDRMEPRILGNNVSLNAPVLRDEEDGEGQIANLVDPTANPEEEASRSHDWGKAINKIFAIIGDMPEREQDILKARLLKQDKEDLAVIGARLGITKERVRQIERKGIEYVRRAMVDNGYQASDFFAVA